MQKLVVLMMSCQFITAESLVLVFPSRDKNDQHVATFLLLGMSKIKVNNDKFITNNGKSFEPIGVVNVKIANAFKTFVRFDDLDEDYEKIFYFRFWKVMPKEYQEFNEEDFLNNPASYSDRVVFNFQTKLRIIINNISFPLSQFVIMAHVGQSLGDIFVTSRYHTFNIYNTKVKLEPGEIEDHKESLKVPQYFVANPSAPDEIKFIIVKKEFISNNIKSLSFSSEELEAGYNEDLAIAGTSKYLYVMNTENVILFYTDCPASNGKTFLNIFVNDFLDSHKELVFVQGKFDISLSLLCDLSSGDVSPSQTKGVLNMFFICQTDRVMVL